LGAGAASIVWLLVSWLVLGGVPAASAHTRLLSVTPADGSTVAATPTSVVLSFDEAVATIGAAVVVTAPSGARVSDGDAVVAGAVVSQRLLPLTEPGRYVVAYRVVADDGHPVAATTSFSLGTASGSVSPSAPSTSSSSPSSSSPSSSPPSSVVPTAVGAASGDGGVPVVAVAAGALLLAVAAGLVLVVAVRRRTPPQT
jgi:methionine-rich copper-binding protein CopC